MSHSFVRPYSAVHDETRAPVGATAFGPQLAGHTEVTVERI